MFEFLFNYSSEVFQQGQFIFASQWPVWTLACSYSVFAIIIIYFLYRQRRHLGAWRIVGIGVLQLVMLALVLLLVWQPSLLLERLRAGDNIIAMMLDTSASMAYGDGELSRVDQARAIATGDAFTQLRLEYPFRQFIFSDQASEVDNYEELPLPIAGTDLGTSILKVLRQAGSTSLGALILLSDGADNSGSLDQNQLAEISSFGVPIHTIGIGREVIPEDMELTEVVMPEKTLPNSTLSARLGLRHDAGGEVRVKVYDGDDFLAATTVELDTDEAVTTAWLEFKVNGSGPRELRFSVDPLPGERNLRNNARSHVIDIPEQNYRILYVEGEPRWEYKFMRRALHEDSSVQLVSMLRVSTNKFYRQGIEQSEELAAGFPDDKTTLFSFHALIIGSIEAPLFTPDQQQLIYDFVSERGGSLLMLAGPNGLGSGHWGNTVVGKIMPAALPESDTAFVRTRSPVTVTPAGRQSPMLKFSDDAAENDRLWRELPELADYQLLGALRPAAVTLLNITVDNRSQPLFITQPYGRGHTYILATGGTWRWQMSSPVEDLRHETFWRQLLRGMVADTPKSFELSSVIEGNKLNIRADIRNQEFEPVADVAVAAVITPGAGESVTLDLLPVPDQPGVYQGVHQPDRSGLISVEAISRRGDEPLETVRTSVYNDAGDAEFFSMRQNRPLLERLAEVTGGQYWNADELKNLPDAIQLSRAGITEQDIRPLWDAPAIFLLLILLKCAEWLLRRRWRTI